MKDSFFDIATNYVKGVVTLRRYPGIAVAFMFLLGPVVYVSYTHWGVNSHLRKAREMYEQGNFPGAIEETNLYLEEEPDAIDGLDMLGDAHSAMMQISRGNFDKYMTHRCKAIATYKKRLEIRFNNNVNSKLAMMENEEFVDRGGNYVRCKDGEVVSPETGLGGESSEEPW